MSLRKAALLRNLPPLPPSSAPSHRSTVGGPRRRNYSPLSWEGYFDRCEDFKTSDKNLFRVYFRGKDGPALLCLHGGGHSALSWALLAVSLTKMANCQVIAMDIRGHGSTQTEDDGDLRASTLVNDVLDVVSVIFPDESTPPIVLVGHSMGGAVAVRVAVRNVLSTLAGLVVLDVVEGMALESLSTMQSYLRGRPKSFPTLEKAIEWSIRSGQVRSVESARVTMIGQLTRKSSGETSEQAETQTLPTTQELAVVKEDDEEATTDRGESAGQSTPSESAEHREPKLKSSSDGEYVWRIDLSKTEPFWLSWFTDLSRLFLSASVPKVLILAGIDRLDKELSIGQMQGKFQMQVLSGCGHLVQEDVPEKVADILATFLYRYKLVESLNKDFTRNEGPYPVGYSDQLTANT